MIKALTGKLSYSGTIATIALFLALGGGAYALTLPRDSVGARQIKRDAVRASELRKDAVAGAEIRRDAVGSGELRDDAVRAGELAPGSVSRKDLGFALGEAAGSGDVQTAPRALAPGAGFAGVAQTRLVEREAAGRIALLHGALSVKNAGDDGKPTDVTVRVLADGRPEPGTFTVTIPDGFSDAVPVSIACDLLPAGEHTFTLEARADGGSGVNLGTRSLDAASFRPIWNPPTLERIAR